MKYAAKLLGELVNVYGVVEETRNDLKEGLGICNGISAMCRNVRVAWKVYNIKLQNRNRRDKNEKLY